jgi:tape measure domain-containing protein
MSSIDQRIVSMVFENAKFEAGVAKSMDTLRKFNEALGKSGNTNAFSDIDKAANKVTLQGPMSALDKLRSRLFNSGQGAAEGLGEIDRAGNKVTLEQPISAVNKVQSAVGSIGSTAAQGFSEIENAASRVSLGGLTSALDQVTGKFGMLKGAATVALGNIEAQAAMKGASFAKSFALGPIQQGLGEYQTNLGSIQTILSNTADSGGNLQTVNAALNELNTYSDKTIYNFSEMARNIGTFTAAGVQLKPATAAIKGIANLAALSGSNSQQASTAMYQLSQAIAAGKVGLQDWNSVVNAGMGGAVFQKSLMRTAQNMGKLSKGAVKIDKATGKATVNGESFRNSIMAKPGQDSWLTSDVLTETLSQMTGDLSDAQLAAKGFSQDEIKAIQAQAKRAQDAATQVKTLAQVWDVARETIGSGWGKTFQLIFGNFSESKKTFTDMSNTLNAFINHNARLRNHLLADWRKFGGRTTLIKGIKVAFRDLLAVMKPIRLAFRDIFPAKTGGDLLHMTRSFVAFMASLRAGTTTSKNLHRTFRGLFALIHMGGSIISQLFHALGTLFKGMGVGNGGILDFTGNMGDFLVKLDKAVSSGQVLAQFFHGLIEVIRPVANGIKAVGQHIQKMIPNGAADKITGIKDVFDRLGEKLKELVTFFYDAGENAKQFFNMLGGLGSNALNFLKTVLGQVWNIVKAIGDAFANANFDQVGAIVQTGIVGGIFLAIKKALGGGGGLLGGVQQSLGNLNALFKGLSGNLEAMQKNLQAKTLTQIAIAIGILAGAVLVLSTISPDKLTMAMGAITLGMGQLVGTMALMGKLGGVKGKFGKLGFGQASLAGSLIALATALAVLAAAMKIFSTMKWEDIAKGTAGIVGSLGAINVAMRGMMGPQMLLVGPALITVAVALNLLAGAMKIFATMDWESLDKGLAGVGGSLLAIGAATSLMGPTLVLVGPGLVAVAIAMSILAGAMKIFATMKWEDLGKGLAAIGASLGIIALAMWALPPTMAFQAAGLVIIAGAMTALAGVMKIFASMDGQSIARAVVAMATSLGILALGLYAMEGTLPGAAALALASVGLLALAPALAIMGNLKFSTIIKGMIVIAATLGILALAGTVAAPSLSALGIALLPLAGFFILSAGAALLFAKALQIMGSAGAKGAGIAIAAITAFVMMLPKWIISIAKGIVEVVAMVAKVLPDVIKSLAVIINEIAQFLLESSAPIALAIDVFLGQLIKIIVVNAPKLIAAGGVIIVSLLTGIANNIGKLTTKAAEIVVNFLNALSGKMPDLVTAGIRLLGKLLEGIAHAAAGIGGKAAEIVLKFIGGITGKLPELLAIGSRLIANLIIGLGKHVERLARAGGAAVLHVLSGIGDQIVPIEKKAVWLAGRFIRAFVNAVVGLADTVATGIIRLMNGLAKVIRTREGEFWDAAANLGHAIGEGLKDGMMRALPGPFKTAISGAHKIVHGVKGVFKSKSPSKVFMGIGSDLMLGLGQGIDQGHGQASKSATRSASDIVSTMQKTMKNVPNLLDGIAETDPTITPVLDLSQIKKDAGAIGDITSVSPIKADVSASQASVIAQQKADLDKSQAEQIAAAAKPSVEFKQYNNSPEALPAAEIYRRTNNAISQIRKQVGVLSE